MKQCTRIFIVGHPGAGKGLLAKTLAEQLDWRFIDADFGLEAKTGMTIPEILGETCENSFHSMKSKVLAYQVEQKNIVVTTDAAIVLNEKNRQLLSSEFVVYLTVSTPIQIERTSVRSEALLPINSKIFFDKLHTERDALYEEIATVSINSDDSELEAHVSGIMKIVSGEKINKMRNKEVETVFFHKSLHVPVSLTVQQAHCLKFLAQGKSAKEIARDMNISYRTVEGNIAKAMELLGCSSSKELVALYHNRP
jgi:shikimate kinase